MAEAEPVGACAQCVKCYRTAGLKCSRLRLQRLSL